MDKRKQKQIRKLNKYLLNTKANILGIKIDSPEKERFVSDLILEDEVTDFLKKQKRIDTKKAKAILDKLSPIYIHNIPLYRRMEIIRKVKDLELYQSF